MSDAKAVNPMGEFAEFSEIDREVWDEMFREMDRFIRQTEAENKRLEELQKQRDGSLARILRSARLFPVWLDELASYLATGTAESISDKLSELKEAAATVAQDAETYKQSDEALSGTLFK